MSNQPATVSDFGCDYTADNNSDYLVCLRAANGTSVWVDLTDYSTHDDFLTLANQWAEDVGGQFGAYAIADIEGLPDGMGLEQFYECAETVSPADTNFPALLAYVAAGYDASGFDENFRGTWRSELDFAENLVDDLGILPSEGIARDYFDYNAFSRDLFLGDYFSLDAPGGQVWVFSAH